MISFRLAGTDDFERLQEIEVRAGAPFRDVGMADVADDDPPTVEQLDAYRAGGRAWVAIDDLEPDTAPPGSSSIAAYVLVDVLRDGDVHVEQVSVDPAWRGKGIGAGLIDHVDAWARTAGASRLTLTTFRDVPWNRPYYERLGFVVLGTDAWTDDLRRIRDHETDAGLDADVRVIMARPLHP